MFFKQLHDIIALYGSTIFYLIFCIVVLEVAEREYIEVFNRNYGFFSFSFHFHSFCFTYFAALLFGAYVFRVVRSPLVDWPFYHYLMSGTFCFSLKTTLSDINIETLVFFLLMLAWHVVSVMFHQSIYCLKAFFFTMLPFFLVLWLERAGIEWDGAFFACTWGASRRF